MQPSTQTIVIALGGNALQRQGEASAADQQRVARETARHLVPLVEAGHRLVIVHGNGPQVGNIILHEEAINTPEVPTLPLDSCGAMSQGSIGYWLQNALQNELQARGHDTPVVTVVSQMVVDEQDPAFDSPTKPIGPFYATEDEARQAASERQFTIAEDAGRGWRRVVPSPKPQRVVEQQAIQTLVDSGAVVICAGGGGIPVVASDQGCRGVEAVIDKDFSAATVAAMLGADQLIILTAVDTVMIHYGTPEQQALTQVSATDMQRYADEGHFAPGSMLPKVLAAMQFATSAQAAARIGSLERVAEVIDGTSGTTITA